MDAEAQPGRYVMIQVADTGIGIPADIRDRIFEPFFTTKEAGRGTGLGLAIVQAVVKSHGGFIDVNSEQGRGTTVTVYLPALAEEGISDTAAITNDVAFPRGHGELLLVVEDETAVRTITQKTLESFGYRVLIAQDGTEAVALYVQHREEIAIVLTDMIMPIMDGFATIRALLHIKRHIKMIAVSGLAAHEVTAKLTNLGVKHFLQKPYTAGTLLRLVAEVLKEE
jgi:CheY-like chemotaxis protein